MASPYRVSGSKNGGEDSRKGHLCQAGTGGPALDKILVGTYIGGTALLPEPDAVPDVRLRQISLFLLTSVIVWIMVSVAGAGEPARGTAVPEPEPPSWHYGGFIDLSYPVNFNFPENHRWRSRTTTPRTNELAPNMAMAYLRKEVAARSSWGMELAVQGGYDSKEYAFGQDRPLMDGADTLRHIPRANLSYHVPVGNGLTLTTANG
jgi:hypothetical protein